MLEFAQVDASSAGVGDGKEIKVQSLFHQVVSIQID